MSSQTVNAPTVDRRCLGGTRIGVTVRCNCGEVFPMVPDAEGELWSPLWYDHARRSQWQGHVNLTGCTLAQEHFEGDPHDAECGDGGGILDHPPEAEVWCPWSPPLGVMSRTYVITGYLSVPGGKQSTCYRRNVRLSQVRDLIAEAGPHWSDLTFSPESF